MTVAHPAGISLAPPANGRTRPTRTTAAGSAERETRLGAFASVLGIGDRPVGTPDPVAPEAPAVRARHVAQARMGLAISAIVLRSAVAVALAAAVYFVIANGVIGAVTQDFASWYATTIAPYAAMDFAVTGDAPASPLGTTVGIPEMLRPAA